MATPTYDLIASQVLSTSAASVSFTSIPATYRDLVLVIEATSASTSYPHLRFNGDSGSNYNRIRMSANGSTATSNATANANQYYPSSSAAITSSAGFICIVSFMDYSATDKHKSFISRANNAANGLDATAARWANTAAINSCLITCDGSNFAAGSTFYLYGIVS